jgi:CRISPR-associated protein Cas2
MHVILVYDVEEKRVAKALKVCRQYLNWIQNSVFEGDLSEAKLKELKLKLKKVLDLKKDSVLIFKVRDAVLLKREIMGQEKNPLDTIL